jgi:hypothetical protein
MRTHDFMILCIIIIIITFLFDMYLNENLFFNFMSGTQREAEILASAKQVMDNFFVSLSSRHVNLQQIGLNRTIQTRLPKVVKSDLEFKYKILANAPLKNQDYIIAEKKSW